MGSSRSPSLSLKENKSPPSGRVLFCRKCECHGLQVILKGHAPRCPYELCNCHACEKLMNKRMRSFEKRNGDLIKSALQAKKNQHSNSLSPRSSTSDSDEMLSNGKPMTVMSYEIWKMKCAQEKKEREAKEKENPVPPTRKRTYPFGDEPKELTAGDERGTYVTLPTIPPMRVLIDGDKKTIIVPERRPISPNLTVNSTPSASSTTSPPPSSRPRLSSLPLPTSTTSLHLPTSTTSIPPPPSTTSLPSPHFHSSSLLHSSPTSSASSDLLLPRLSSIPSSTTVAPSLPPTVIPSLPTVPSTTSTLTSSDISSILQTMPTSVLLRNCALNHERLQHGLPIVSLTQSMPPPPPTVPPPIPGAHSVESSLLSTLATLIGSQSPSVSIPSSTSISSLPPITTLPKIPFTHSPFVPSLSIPQPTPKFDPSSFSPDILQLLSQFLPQ
ncbi:hypothetical protein PMAYCL1PPCAC_18417 [Pristionchus mayeri]|uniref:DM domain-containing protein n=1 Tax=Pristionchus mayeri TaxID=1317129 RepID=A0AAN5I1A1_9BILA|nr:hypothetical protein PMAYCL1PPCAC_18417 [Pristionchus mayeri]